MFFFDKTKKKGKGKADENVMQEDKFIKICSYRK